MCVFEILVLRIVVERWFWELNILIRSLVELHVGLHSCLCFSQFEKLVLKVGSTPPRYLAVCRPSSAFSYRNLDNFLILGGSIEKAPASSIALRHLVDRSSFCSWICWVVPRYLSCRRPFPRYLHLTSFTEGLYIPSSRSNSHFFNLSRSVRTCSSPKHSLSHSKPLPLWFFKIIHLLVSF